MGGVGRFGGGRRNGGSDEQCRRCCGGCDGAMRHAVCLRTEVDSLERPDHSASNPDESHNGERGRVRRGPGIYRRSPVGDCCRSLLRVRCNRAGTLWCSRRRRRRAPRLRRRLCRGGLRQAQRHACVGSRSRSDLSTRSRPRYSHGSTCWLSTLLMFRRGRWACCRWKRGCTSRRSLSTVAQTRAAHSQATRRAAGNWLAPAGRLLVEVGEQQASCAARMMQRAGLPRMSRGAAAWKRRSSLPAGSRVGADATPSDGSGRHPVALR
jgi:hypothetical protein